MEKRSVLLLLYLTCSLPACCWAFACFESTVCRGDSIPGVARKGDCCAGEGLSFTDEEEQCFDCFSEAAFSGEGNEFFLAFFDNLFPGPLFSRANVRLSVGAMGVGVGQDGVRFMVESREDQEMERTGTGGTPTEVGLQVDIRLEDVSDRDEGIRVRSLDGRGLSIVALTEEFTSVETFKVLPCVFLPNQGYEYFVVSVQPPPVDPEIGAPIEERSAFAVISSEDQTLINLTLTRRVDISDASDLVRQIGSEVIEIGQPVAITLNQRQSLYISSIADLSGSRVVTNKPVSFITGHECGNIPRNFTFCDQMVEQIPPTATWGYEFLTAPISSRNGVDVFKAVPSLSSGSFTRICFLPSGEIVQNIEVLFQQTGQPVEFQVSSDEYCYFESSVPTLLLQFSAGTGVDNVTSADPFMVMVPPIQQYQNSFLLSTFQSQAVQGVNYLNIFVPSEVDLSGVFLDGNQVTELLGEGGWVEISCPDRESTCGYAAQLNVSAQSHVLNHSNPSARFSVIAYWLAFRAGHGYVGGLSQRPIALPQVTFETAAVSIFENESSVGIDLMRSGRDFGRNVEVFIKSRDNTAIAGEDYIAFNTSIVFGPEEFLKRIQVELAPDDVFPEDSKSFDIFLTASPGVYLSPTTVVNVTILNNDPPLPEVNISFAETLLTVREGVGIIQFRLLKADDTSLPGGRGVVHVRLTTEDGSAVGAPFGQGDYQPLVEEVTFDVSDMERTVTTTIADNDVLENVESFTATIVALEGPFPVAVVMNGTVTVEIVDDDIVIVGFTQALFTVSEVVRMVDVGVELLFGVTNVSFDVIVSTVNDFDAVAGEDFEAVTTTRSFGRDFQDTQIVLITILDDNKIESSETIPLQLRIAEGISSGGIQIIPEVAQVLIQDNDRLLIGLDGPSEVRVEEGESVEVTVRVLEGSLAEDTELLVGLSAISGTARAGVDFEGMTNLQLDFIGDASSQTVRIGTIEDEAFEEQETFFVLISLLSCPGAGEVDDRRASITVVIENDDPLIIESQCFPLAGCSGNPLPNQTLEDCCTTVGFSFQLEGGVNICQPCILVGFSQPIYNLRERGIPYVLTVNLSKGDSLPQSLSLAVNAMPLTASLSDFQVMTPDIALLSESPQAEVRVTLPQETLDENDDMAVETFILLLNDELGLAPANVFFRQSVVNIEDTPVRIGFAQDSYTVQEGLVRGLSLVVASNGVNDVLIEVVVTLQPGTATLNDDYIGGQTTLTFQPGSTQQTLFISIVNDDILEMTEQFTAQLSLEGGGAIITQSSTTVIITDNDSVTIGFEQTTYTVGEGQVVEVCAVVTSGTLTRDAFVRLSSIDDEAAAPGDYNPIVEDLTFSATASVTRVCINVITVDDTILEDDEDFTLILTATVGRLELTPNQATVTIIDSSDSGVFLIGFEFTLYIANEGVELAVELCVDALEFEGRPERPAIVSFATFDGSATSAAPVDYVDTAVDFSFGFGVRRNCVNVTIANDDILESQESFFSTLFTADVNVHLIPDAAQVVIIEDPDDRVTIGFVPAIYSVFEFGNGPLIPVTVELIDGILETSVSVNLHTIGATATADEDYIDIPPTAAITLVFDPLNDERSANISIINDVLLERTESFFGELTTTLSTVTLDPQRANISIFDNDEPVFLGFLTTQYTAEEDDGTVNLLVGFFSGTVVPADIVVRFYTKDGTAIQPMDYLEVDILLTFSPTVTNLSVPVTINNDLVDEPREGFEACLELITSPIAIVAPALAIVIIEDNDGVAIGLERATYNVTEGVETVEVCAVLFIGALARNTVVALSTSDGSAMEPTDYGRISVELTFNTTVSRACADVTIVDDDVFETEESFSVTLTTIDGDVTLEPDSGILFITDEDELEIGYEFSEYTVDESALSVEVCAVVTRGIVGTTKRVRFNLEEASATEPEDYGIPSTLVYTFFPRSTRDCAGIPVVIDDFVDQGFLERFFGNLVSVDPASPRITLTPDRTRITIVDNDDRVCSLPADPGPCDAAIPSYFFNSETGRCEGFSYGGCEGNPNRFETLIECLRFCGSVKVADLNMSRPGEQCPDGLTLITSPRRLCRKTTAGLSCDSVIYSTNNTQYKTVCGKVIGLGINTPDAFFRFCTGLCETIEGPYVDGISITHGSPREHIWSFAVDLPGNFLRCPCSTGSTFTTPSFVGDDYTCEVFTSTEPVWDGQGCTEGDRLCCQRTSVPIFCKELPEPTTDDIEVRLCADQLERDEIVAVESIELYIQ